MWKCFGKRETGLKTKARAKECLRRMLESTTKSKARARVKES